MDEKFVTVFSHTLEWLSCSGSLTYTPDKDIHKLHLYQHFLSKSCPTKNHANIT